VMSAGLTCAASAVCKVIEVCARRRADSRGRWEQVRLEAVKSFERRVSAAVIAAELRRDCVRTADAIQLQSPHGLHKPSNRSPYALRRLGGWCRLGTMRHIITALIALTVLPALMVVAAPAPEAHALSEGGIVQSLRAEIRTSFLALEGQHSQRWLGRLAS
jgi:hypothetical protein